jgi:nicotinamidase-related amidase
MPNTLNLPATFYRAVPTSDPPGRITETWSLDMAKTCFVSLHCWNVGCPGGPPVPDEYWVDFGFPETHEVGWQVLMEELLPCLQAARKAGLTVVHVQSELIGKRYPHLQPPMAEPSRRVPARPGPVSNHPSIRANRVHGEGFNDWEGWKRLDFPDPVKPLANETVVVGTEQWDDWLREKGIDTLIYAGFCTNLCILDAPGGMRQMAPIGYRCLILREATLGAEFPETLAERIQTRETLRFIEAWVGYTGSTKDFLRACGA